MTTIATRPSPYHATGLMAGLAGMILLSPPHSSQAQGVKEQPKAEQKAKAPPRYSVPPTFANVRYGDHERQVLDFFKADTKEPAPLVVHIHGGGWVNGDKVGVGDLKKLLENGISVASINYRFFRRPSGRDQAAREVAAGRRRAGRAIPPIEGWRVEH